MDGAAADMFLSFDCATKTLAFALLLVRRDWRALIEAGSTDPFVRVLDMETADLFPGRPDAGIHTVERAQALIEYLRRRVDPRVDARAHVLVEYQMGQNARARVVAHALCAHYHAHNTRLVGASWKNTLYLAPELAFAKFAGRSGAVKKHTIANLRRAMALSPRVFDFGALAVRVDEHVADAFAQAVVGVMRGLHLAPHSF